jgi:photosystem II stability/assembly factor-like uncharacterized protein
MKILKNILYLSLLSIIFCNTMLAQRWEKVENIPQPYTNNYWLDVYFLPSNPSYGWICGFNGRVIRTSDGGNSWIGSTVPNADHLESIHFPSVNVGYVSGVDGIFKSTNGGGSWVDITPTSSTATLWGCYFPDTNNGFVIGGGCTTRQEFWKTTDGGNNWSLFLGNLPNSGLTDLIVYSMYGLGYASSSGWIWQTTDGGDTWSPWADTGPNDWQEEITRVGNSFLVPTTAGCSGGNGDGGMRFSTDNGASWNTYNTGVRMFGAFLLSSQTGWVSGDIGNVWYTSNGGQDWILKNCGFENGNLDDIWFITSENGWIVGEGVYRLADPLQEADKDSINFENICIPNSVTDEIIIENINFEPDDVTLTILNDTDNEFSIISPGNNFSINSCESIPIQIRFQPKDVGNCEALLNISFNSGTTLYVNLSGFGLMKTASPEDTLLIINPAYCGNENVKGLTWTAATNEESIASINWIEGSKAIENKTTFPYRISTEGTQTLFSAQPIDTGWINARFSCDFMPCSGDTTVTVNAYGVSPIITSQNSMSITLECETSGTKVIPVYNTGNDELVISDARIIESNTNFSVVGWTGNDDMPVVIPAGKSDSVIIRYNYDNNLEDTATLRLVNNDMTTISGEKNPFDIELYGSYGTVDLVTKDTIIDFGKVCIPGKKNIQIFLVNQGTLICDSLDYYNNSSQFSATFNLPEFPYKLPPDDSVMVTISFNPGKQPGMVIDTLYFTSTTCNEVLRLIVMANAVSVGLLTTPSSISETIQTLTPYKKRINVKSTGTEDVEIHIIELGPDSDSLNVEIEPPLPYYMPHDGNVDFDLTFTSTHDINYNGNLCFQGRGYCKVGKCIPLEINSYSAKVEFNKDTVDFGLYLCDPGYYLDTLMLRNTGFIVDTITRLDIEPVNSPFTIINQPTIPFEVSAGDSKPLFIEYEVLQEGFHSATLTMETSSSKTFTSTVFISGEFRRTNSSISQARADFGDVEICDTLKQISINFHNTGTLRDSITIFYASGSGEFIYVPNDYIIIPPNDSTEFIVYMNPSDFPQTGNYTDKLIFESRVCPDFDTLDISVNLFHHMLTIEEKTIDFGTVWADNFVIKNFEITNNSNYPKKVISMLILIDDINFELTNTYNYPIDFLPGDNLSVPVKFTAPAAEGSYNASVEITEESICIDKSQIILSAEVPEEIYRTTVSTENYLSKPGENLTMIVSLDNPINNLKQNGLNYKVSFDPHLFMPTALFINQKDENKKTIPFSYVNGEISGSLDSIDASRILQNAGEVLWIQGIVFLSVPDSTPINIVNFAPVTSKTVDITKIHGSLKLFGACLPLADFPLKIKYKPNITIKENPVSDGALTININSNEKQNCSIKIYTLQGKKVIERDLNIHEGMNEFKLDMNDLYSGLYYINISNYTNFMYRDRIILIK